MNRIDKIALCAAIGLMLTGMMMGFILGRLTNKVTRISDQVVEISRDTVTVHDTTYLDHFREVTKMIVDTMWVSVAPDINVASKLPASDSLLVGLPYEQVTVRDSIFTAQISGYKPHLDWIRITRPTQIVTIEKAAKTPPKKWSIGATAGMGVVYNQNGIQCGPGVMVGVQYRF